MVSAFVGVSQARSVALQAKNLAIPQPIPIRGLIDTGATETCIDPSVVSALGLTPTGTALVNTPSTGNNPHQTYQYDVSLIVPPVLATHSPLLIPNLAVIDAQLASFGIQALIGRDVLSECYLTYDGIGGIFCLAY